MESQSPNSKKWYVRNRWIIALLILFFPAGFFLMWKYAAWHQVIKWVVTVLLVLFVFSSLISSKSTTAHSQQVNQTSTQVSSAQPTQAAMPLPTKLLTPTATAIPIATPTPMKYDTNGFPEDSQQVTFADIAKVPSTFEGKKVVFTCNVLSFPKDDKGNVVTP